MVLLRGCFLGIVVTHMSTVLIFLIAYSCSHHTAASLLPFLPSSHTLGGILNIPPSPPPPPPPPPPSPAPSSKIYLLSSYLPSSSSTFRPPLSSTFRASLSTFHFLNSGLLILPLPLSPQAPVLNLQSDLNVLSFGPSHHPIFVGLS